MSDLCASPRRSHAASTLVSLALVLALAGTVVGSSTADASLLRVYYPDIEQGSATLIVSPTGTAMMVDSGTGLKSVDEGVENFINDLIDAGIITGIDYTVATHYDEDHIGRMENVYQYVPFKTGAVAYDRGTFGGTPTTFAYDDYSFGASAFNRTTVTCSSAAFDLDLGGGVTVKFTTVNGEVCGGPTVSTSGVDQFENNVSVTMVVQYGDFDLWIGGDLTGNPLKGVADVETPTGIEVMNIDVYTVNHHGSDTSSNASFLADLAAEVAINQSSIENNFGHPRADVVNRILATNDSFGNAPLFLQQNPGDPGDTRSDDSLADAIADCDDAGAGEALGLPGTIVLLSDGTSYRIHACGIAATTLSADEGLGTIGDYPPAIRSVAHTPRVPTAAQAVTVTATLEDTASAEIRYALDGVAQTPIAMSFGGGVSWSGAIPAQSDGTKVTFRVAATDASAQTELSAAGCFYAGTTDIATFRVEDSASVLVPKTCAVRVRGTMTVEPGIFNDFVTQAYVQDGTAAVQVFDRAIDPAILRGDTVEWVGELEQFAGQTEVNAAENFGNFGSTRIGSGTVPAPQVVTVAQVGEALEGELIRINGVTIDTGFIFESGNSTLTITDDGGISTISLRIDGDTDIPGVNTPTQAFDIVGIASQFDTWVPLDGGFQILPRERTDLISDEVNFSQVILSEIHADPASGANGDANGDGTRSATHDEFVELLNVGFTAVDISGWTVADSVDVRFTFPANTLIPAREAAVVFGGGTPTGAFGNAADNGLVFTASGLALNNSGDTVTLADDGGVTVQAVTYGSEGGSDESLVRDPDYSNAPFVQHQSANGSNNARWSPGARIDGRAFTVRPGDLVLSEILYDPSGSDSGLEWIELYNTTSNDIVLDDLCLGSGGGDYTNSLISLDGCGVSGTDACVIAAESTFVVGGPDSTADNANPTFDLVEQISPGLQNSGSVADGVALFAVRCAQVTALTVPLDAAVYGDANSNGLIDETGSANAPDVGDASSGQSIERTTEAGAWQIQGTPIPGTTPLNGGGGGPGGGPGGSGDLLLSEVFYDASGSDDGLEWVELKNVSGSSIDLSSYCIGNGGSNYTSSKVPLSGTVAAGATFVVGGLVANASNANPVYDQPYNFSPDFQNSGSTADGVALFATACGSVTSSSVPEDVVIYGGSNSNSLIDETGAVGAVDVGDAPAGQSIERTTAGGTWQIQAAPTPNAAAF
ncbi:MAG: lamin tail domain-containing protein [Acidobacteriota bacterium]